MILPRSSRRVTTSWAVNTVTFTALVSTVWLSAQQRPTLPSEFGTQPAQQSPQRELAPKQPAYGVTPALGTDKQHPDNGTAAASTTRAAFVGGPRGTEGFSLRQVAYRAAAKP